jgi:hypothetical protein
MNIASVCTFFFNRRFFFCGDGDSFTHTGCLYFPDCSGTHLRLGRHVSPVWIEKKFAPIRVRTPDLVWRTKILMSIFFSFYILKMLPWQWLLNLLHSIPTTKGVFNARSLHLRTHFCFSPLSERTKRGEDVPAPVQSLSAPHSVMDDIRTTTQNCHKTLVSPPSWTHW